MGYVNEFPHSRMWDSDLRQILEMYEKLRTLPEQWEAFKVEMVGLWETFKADMTGEWTDYKEAMNLSWEEYKAKMDTDWANISAQWDSIEEEWATVKQEWSDLDAFVTNYFENLNVQTEINNKINEMVADGSFAEILKPIAGTAGLPVSESGGQFLVSTEEGGVAWLTVVNGNEVSY